MIRYGVSYIDLILFKGICYASGLFFFVWVRVEVVVWRLGKETVCWAIVTEIGS